jgi:hypothetical protein
MNMSASGNDKVLKSFQYFDEDETGSMVIRRRTTNVAKKEIVLDYDGDFTSLEDVPWDLLGEDPVLFFEFAADVNVHAAVNSIHLPAGLVQGVDAAASLENIKTW